MSETLEFELPGIRKTLKIKPFSTKQADLMSSEKGSGHYTDVMAERIIPDNLGIPPSEVIKFLECDYLAAIIALRRVSIGDKFIYTMKCPKCKEEFDHVADLRDVVVTYLEDGQPLDGMHYKFDTGTIVFKIPRVSDIISMQKELKSFLATVKGEPDQDYVFTFLTATKVEDILDVNGDTVIKNFAKGPDRRNEIRRLVGEWPANFTQTFLFDVDPFYPGFQLGQKYKCTNVDKESDRPCEYTFEGEVPVQEGFFFQSKESLKKQMKVSSKKGKVLTPWKKTKSVNRQTLEPSSS